jgi:hypothetical protein
MTLQTLFILSKEFKNKKQSQNFFQKLSINAKLLFLIFPPAPSNTLFFMKSQKVKIYKLKANNILLINKNIKIKKI